MSDNETRALKNHQPLSPAVFAILLALAGGEKHGYAIMKEAAEPAGEPSGSAPAPSTARSTA
jgi:hypothetical protein